MDGTINPLDKPDEHDGEFEDEFENAAEPVPEPEAIHEFVAEAGAERVDNWLTERIADMSRNRIKDLIVNGHVTLNGQTIKPSQRVRPDDLVRMEVPPPAPSPLEPQDIPLDILYEDEDMLAINKPAGLVVHPAKSNQSGTLVNALLYYCDDLAGVGGEERPGIVHRLDKETSGVIVVAKRDTAHRKLQDQFRERTTDKTYIAVVRGVPDTVRRTIDAPLDRHPHHRVKRAIVEGGRHAITHYVLLEDHGEHAVLHVKIETGRTHQIRVHLASIGHPVLGDKLYGGKQPEFGIKRQLLHAYRLRLAHPRTGEAMAFEAPLPEDLHPFVDGKTLDLHQK